MSVEPEQQEKEYTASQFGEPDVLVPSESDEVPAISIVLPTMNEEDGIEECITCVKKALRLVGLRGEIIVSDVSEDRTPTIARDLGARVVEPDAQGYGYAYRYAFRFARGDLLVMGDADTTYDFEELPRFLQCMERTGADIVIGSRLMGDIKRGAMPALHQYLGNPLLTTFLNMFYDAGVSDAHSGFRLFTREALDTLDLQTPGMEFASEMIMDASGKGLAIAEVPITYHERAGEATLNSFRDGWRHIKFMLVNAPGQLFTGPGIGLVMGGLVLMLLSLLNRPLSGVYFGTHTVIAGSLLTIVGYQIGSLAVFSAVAASPIRQPQDSVTGWLKENFRLEHGATLGVGLCAIGIVSIGYLAVQWVASGYTRPPFVVANMLGFTALVLGFQTIFYSLFLSVLGQQRQL